MAKKEDKERKEGSKKGRNGVSKEAKRKLIPPFVMLAAGAVTSILMVIKGCGLNEFLFRLLVILLIFYVLGCLLKDMLDRFDRQNTPPEPEEEEDVIEKDPETEEAAEKESAEAAEEQAGRL